MTQVTDAQLAGLLEALGYVQATSAKGVWFLPNGSGTFTRLHRLRTWEGFGAIQAAMAGRGWTFMMRGAPGEDYSVEFHTRSIPRYFYGDGSTAPDAIVFAARAALGLDKEDTR